MIIDILQSKTIVNEDLWKFVKERFSAHVQSRMEGIDNLDVDEVFPCLPIHQFAEHGDIRTEFEIELEKVREEERLRKEQEEQLGESLAQELEREEQRQLEEAREQESLGLETARRMWRDITNTPVTARKRNRSVLDMMKSSNSPNVLTKNHQEDESSSKFVIDNVKRKKSFVETLISQTSAQESTICDNKDVNFPDYDDNIFSPDIVEEQRRIERMLHQEKQDAELALKLQKENSSDNCPSLSEINIPSTPKTSVKRFYKRLTKSHEISSRQLSLSRCSPKSVSQDSCINSKSSTPCTDASANMAKESVDISRLNHKTTRDENGLGEKSKTSLKNPVNFFKPTDRNSSSCKKLGDSDNKLVEDSKNVKGEKQQFGEKSQVKSKRNPLDLLKQKVENDLNTNVASCSKAPDDDEIFARKLQQELNKEMVQKPNQEKENNDAFDVLKSQKSSSKTCKLRHKTKSCNKCAGCLRENCGKCVPCRDMPKFGGKCVLKQKCVYRKCVHPVKSSCSSCS